MSRVAVTVVAKNLNNASNDSIDFNSVVNYFDSTQTGVKVIKEEANEATGTLVLDTDIGKFDAIECTDIEITGQLVQFQPITQEKTSITVRGEIVKDISFNIQASAEDFNVECKITGNELQATGTWNAINKFRCKLKDEMQQFLKSTKTQLSLKCQNASKVAKGVKQVSMLSGDVLALMQKCGVFVNDYLTYNLRYGSVTIECPGDDETATSIAEEFQTQYSQLMMGGKLKEHSFPIPSTYNAHQIIELVSQCNDDHSQSIFKHDQANNVIKCLSMNARQLSHIKGKLKELFLQPQAAQESSKADTPTRMSLLLAGGRKVTLKQADITQEVVDAIVNAANDRLVHGGGVALAINKASNGAVQQQSTLITQQYGLVKVGHAVYTGAGGALKCKYVIHTVGPQQHEHKEKSQELLWMACINTLQLAEKLGVTSLAIPPISSGIFGVPKNVVAKTIINAVCQYPCHPGGLLTDVHIVIVNDSTFKTFKPFFIEARASITVLDKPQNGHLLPTNHLQHSQSCPETYYQDHCITCKNKTADTSTSCPHKYCKRCKEKNPYCPVCKVPVAFQQEPGDQPYAKMTYQILNDKRYKIPGYEDCSTIKIQYFIPNGIQGPTHPHPKRQFTGNTFHAYLPNSPEGKEVLTLLTKAFHAKLIFTVGKNNKVIWNGILHKTNLHGGCAKYSYPDPDYLKRIKEELQFKLGFFSYV